MRAFVLGLGSIGHRHAVNLRCLGLDVAGYDPDPAADPTDASGLRRMPTRAALFAEARAGDILVIASPSRQHEVDLADGIANGLHIFVEKPVGHRIPQLLALADRATAAGLVVYPGLNLRHHPAVIAARRLLSQGAIGAPLWGAFACHAYLPDWRPERDYRRGYAADTETGGVILDIVHEFDLAWHLLGPYEIDHAVTRRTGHLDLPTEDYAAAILRHSSGLLSTLQVDYVTRPPRRESTVAGTEGRLVIDVGARTLSVLASDGHVRNETYDTSFADDYVIEMRHFLSCVAGHAQPACPLPEATAVLARALTARQKGRPR